jgi:hypothetical protein
VVICINMYEDSTHETIAFLLGGIGGDKAEHSGELVKGGEGDAKLERKSLYILQHAKTEGNAVFNTSRVTQDANATRL